MLILPWPSPLGTIPAWPGCPRAVPCCLGTCWEVQHVLPRSPRPCQPSRYRERVLWELWDGWRMSEGPGKAPARGQMEPPRNLGGVPSCAILRHPVPSRHTLRVPLTSPKSLPEHSRFPPPGTWGSDELVTGVMWSGCARWGCNLWAL